MVEAGKLVVGIIGEEGSDDPPHGNNKIAVNQTKVFFVDSMDQRCVLLVLGRVSIVA